MLLLFDSTPVPLLSRSWLDLGFPSGEAEGRGAFIESSPPPSPSSGGLADGGRVGVPVGVLVCL